MLQWRSGQLPHDQEVIGSIPEITNSFHIYMTPRLSDLFVVCPLRAISELEKLSLCCCAWEILGLYKAWICNKILVCNI